MADFPKEVYAYKYTDKYIKNAKQSVTTTSDLQYIYGPDDNEVAVYVLDRIGKLVKTAKVS